MPVLPDPKTFAPGTNNGSSNPQSQNDQDKKATAQDFISKGPQIPDSKTTARHIEAELIVSHRHAS